MRRVSVFLVVALALFTFPLLHRWKPIIYLTGLYLLAFAALIWVYPTALEQYTVKPNEVTKEAPYIKNNIKFTRLAYGLNKIEEKDFKMEKTKHKNRTLILLYFLVFILLLAQFGFPLWVLQGIKISSELQYFILTLFRFLIIFSI